MEFHSCTDQEHKAVRQQPGFICSSPVCWWMTDCSLCMNQHTNTHRAVVKCTWPGCAMEVRLTPSLRWPRHGGDGNPDHRCPNSGKKYSPAPPG